MHSFTHKPTTYFRCIRKNIKCANFNGECRIGEIHKRAASTVLAENDMARVYLKYLNPSQFSYFLYQSCY